MPTKARPGSADEGKRLVPAGDKCSILSVCLFNRGHMPQRPVLAGDGPLGRTRKPGRASTDGQEDFEQGKQKTRGK